MDKDREVRTAALFEQQRVNFGYRPTLDVASTARRILATLRLLVDPKPGRACWLRLGFEATWHTDDALERLDELQAEFDAVTSAAGDSEITVDKLSEVFVARIVMDLEQFRSFVESVAELSDAPLDEDVLSAFVSLAGLPTYVTLDIRFGTPGLGVFGLFTLGLWTGMPPPNYFPPGQQHSSTEAERLDLEEVSAVVEGVFYEQLAFALQSALIDLQFDLDINRRVEGKFAASPAFYCYDLVPDVDGVLPHDRLLRTHLTVSSTRSLGTSASMYGDAVRVVRREIERSNMYKPLYLLTF